MSNKFFIGVAVGLISGMLLIEYSKETRKFMDKGKRMVKEKVEDIVDKF